MLETAHSPLLVLASLAVSLLAAFTGLSLTHGLSALALPTRKTMVAMGAVALGGGIWSMHFVAMLGLRLPVPFFYDPLITLISALVAILVAGLSLLLLHFRERTTVSVLGAGALMGLGIAAMHYIGMSGIELCTPVYTAWGILLPVLASAVLGALAIWIAYGERRQRNILIGTLVFGCAVFAVHFLAMANTGFLADPDATLSRPMIGNDTLALLVTLAAFIICAGFLLTASTFTGASPDVQPATSADTNGPVVDVLPPAVPDPAPQPVAVVEVRIPFERHGRTEFIAPEAVAAIRAEGHYTILYAGADKLFCPWSISKAKTRLPEAVFAQVHRSYLVNPSHITGFERRKDNGVVFFETTPSLDKVPVSRSRLAEIRDRLGL